MTKEQLQTMNKKELVAICKENNIPHYHGKNVLGKQELINAITSTMEKQDDIDDAKKAIEESGNASVEHVEALTHNIPKLGLHKTMTLFNKLKGDIDENQ